MIKTHCTQTEWKLSLEPLRGCTSPHFLRLCKVTVGGAFSVLFLSFFLFLQIAVKFSSSWCVIVEGPWRKGHAALPKTLSFTVCTHVWEHLKFPRGHLLSPSSVEGLNEGRYVSHKAQRTHSVSCQGSRGVCHCFLAGTGSGVLNRGNPSYRRWKLHGALLHSPPQALFRLPPSPPYGHTHALAALAR